MYVLILLVLTVIRNGDSYIETINSKPEDSILLQKLHHLQKRSEPDIVHIPTWNEMLADVMVNKIKIFSFHKSDEQNAASTEYVGVADTTTQPGIVTRIVSNVLNIFKTFIYDPWFHIYKNTEVENLQITNKAVDESEVLDPKEDVEIIEPNLNRDVEIIEPKYHGRLYDNCTDPLVKCPDGQDMNEKGDCVDSKASNLIFNIPYYCPRGYRRDMFGICRLTI